MDRIIVANARGYKSVRGRIFQIDKLYLMGRVQGYILAITKDEDCSQNLDKQAKVHDLKKHIYPVRCLLSNGVDRMFINFMISRQRRLGLWRGINKNSGAIKGVISYNCHKIEIKEIKDDSKRDD